MKILTNFHAEYKIPTHLLHFPKLSITILKIAFLKKKVGSVSSKAKRSLSDSYKMDFIHIVNFMS